MLSVKKWKLGKASINNKKIKPRLRGRPFDCWGWAMFFFEKKKIFQQNMYRPLTLDEKFKLIRQLE